jgi:hypothetical protein
MTKGTPIRNSAINDRRISIGALGTLCYLLSMRNEDPLYSPTNKSVAAENKCGVATVTRYVKELEKYGYIVKTAIRNERGRTEGIYWDITDLPE